MSEDRVIEVIAAKDAAHLFTKYMTVVKILIPHRQFPCKAYMNKFLEREVVSFFSYKCLIYVDKTNISLIQNREQSLRRSAVESRRQPSDTYAAKKLPIAMCANAPCD